MQRRTFLSSLAWPVLALTGCGGGGAGAPDAPPTLPGPTPVGTLVVSNHAAVTATDGSVIVIGGDRAQSTLSDAVDRFDPATRRLTRIASLASGRISHTALALPDGRILLAGGITSLEIGPLAELIDPQRGTVGEGGRLALPRNGHAMTLLADGRVLLSGGVARDSAELWDPATNRWRLLPSRLQHARAGHSATLLGDGRVLLAGGDAMGRGDYVFAELWDPRTEAFTPLDSGISDSRMLHAAWRTADGSVFLAGGESALADALVPLASVLRFDPTSLRFAAAPGLAVARTLAAPVPGPDGGVLLIGGQTAAEKATRRLGCWTPAAGEARLPDLPSPRLWHSANRLPDGRVLVIGGEDGDGRHTGDILLLG